MRGDFSARRVTETFLETLFLGLTLPDPTYPILSWLNLSFLNLIWSNLTRPNLTRLNLSQKRPTENVAPKRGVRIDTT